MYTYIVKEMGANNHLISIITTFVLLTKLAVTLAESHHDTRVGFYSTSCPRAEAIVKATVRSHYLDDVTVAPGLLRMHFHDCFVEGCDASILINGVHSEKTARPNLGLKGFEVIDDAKTKLERVCPGVVSCADILALAARDSVVLTSGRSWMVRTGRRDGTISLASNVNLPGPTDSIEVQKKMFASFRLNSQDLVVLAGGHTIGTTSCQLINLRLNNSTSTENSTVGSSIDPRFVSRLRGLCPQHGDPTKRVSLDLGSRDMFDTSFFNNVKNGHAVLESDQELMRDISTRRVVRSFIGIKGSTALDFDVEFGKSMVKMGNIGVKTGERGEIRRVCSKFNLRD